MNEVYRQILSQKMGNLLIVFLSVPAIVCAKLLLRCTSNEQWHDQRMRHRCAGGKATDDVVMGFGDCRLQYWHCGGDLRW